MNGLFSMSDMGSFFPLTNAYFQDGSNHQPVKHVGQVGVDTPNKIENLLKNNGRKQGFKEFKPQTLVGHVGVDQRKNGVELVFFLINGD